MSKDPLIFQMQTKRTALGNRRRTGFVLTRQRDLVPIAMGAALAAILAHAALFYYAPYLSFLAPKHRTLEAEVKDDAIVINLKEPPPKEYEKAKEEPQEILETKEIEDAIREPEVREIDLLDYKPEEITMAPGDTDLVIPAPVEGVEETEALTMEMPATELDAGALQEVNVPEEALQVAEPTPVNFNDVIVMADARTQEQDVQAADSLMNSELRESAKAGEGELPADTRSLAELMGVSNPGKESGVARLGADLLFKFNQCRLTSAARFSMLQLAALIQKNPETDFVIEGHTDSFGGDDYNALLSLQRAAAVCEWLSKNRVPIERVHIRACGNKAPLANIRGTQEQQSLNRRVEIHMRRKGEELPEGCFPASYAVDLDTPTRTQIQNGVRVPEVYEPSGTSVATDGKKPADAKKPEDAKPKDTKPADTKPATPAKPKPATPAKPAAPAKPAKPVKQPAKPAKPAKKPDAKKNVKKK